jgi:hypothetical protein
MEELRVSNTLKKDPHLIISQECARWDTQGEELHITPNFYPIPDKA